MLRNHHSFTDYNYNMDIDLTLRKLNISELNAMQTETIDAFRHSDKDILLLSPTGSGKTLAYLLPLACEIDAMSEEPQAIVVVPGRELAMQSAAVLEAMRCGVRAHAVYGGRPTMEEHRILRDKKPHIIFGTPGRLNDHLDKGNIEWKSITTLVIDEFDKCLQMGFQNEMRKLTTTLANVKRRMLISATEAEEIPQFVNLQRTCRISFLDDNEQIPERISVNIVKSPQKDKLQTLDNLLRDLGNVSSIVFVNYRESVERVAFYLQGHGFAVTSFHGGMEQHERESQLYKFTNASANIMVCTDLASRGLDIPDIANIIHYHLPSNEEAYIHRAGRTARWDKTGQTFFILAPDEILPNYVEASGKDYYPDGASKPIPKPLMATIYIGKGKKDKISKGDIVGFLCKTGGLNVDDIGRIDVKERYTYVAINRLKVQMVVNNSTNQKIKGIRTRVEPVW